MDDRQDSRYEELYQQLLERGLDMHVHNKRRIRNGMILLLLLPVILGVILWVTGSDKIVFLIIWVLCMFALSTYLITIEYIDDSVEKTLEEVTDREADFGVPFPGTEQLGERISERREMIRGKIEARRPKEDEQ